MEQNLASYALSLSVRDFRAVQKAIRILVRAGFSREDATELVLKQRQSVWDRRETWPTTASR